MTHAMIRIVTAASLVALLGCGGSDGSEPGSSGGEVVPETCAGHSQAESCIDPENFEQCRQMEQQCPGRIVVRESCPLQFSCPAVDEAAEGERCEGYAVDDSCVGEDAFAQCRAMAEQCPGAVQVMESCPLQFGCP